MKDKSEKVFAFLDDPEKRRIFLRAGIGGLAILVIVLAIVFIDGSSYPDALYIDSVGAPVASQVEKINLDRPYYNAKVRKKTVTFYKKNGNKTRWLEYSGPTSFYKTFVKSIEGAEAYGLDPDHYELAAIQKDVDEIFDDKGREPEAVAALDVRITASFLLFTTHLIEGRIRNAGYGDFIWNKHKPEENDVDLLLANSSGKLSDIIEALHPDHDQYEKLRKALAEYRKFNVEDKIRLAASVPKQIKPGDSHPSIPGIRQRICITDLKPYDPDDSMEYDKKLVKGIKQFQLRHGLEPDGIIGNSTLTYLNQSLQKKADLIELNLERLRWRPKSWGPDYVAINIPEYKLRVFEGGKKVMEMKVVLGTEYNSTPVFSDTIDYVVFSPTWNVPTSIFEEEFLPRLQKDPTSLDTSRFKIYKDGELVDPTDEDWEDKDLNPEQYRLVENPGEINSLGLVKFMMPNTYNIYLHDTPAERLFKKNERAYSHGCIRLEKPVDFAKFLLEPNEDKWKDDQITEAMTGEEPKNVPLKRKYPVEIEYRTVWVDEDGLLHFREDIYDHDKRQLAMLKRIE